MKMNAKNQPELIANSVSTNNDLQVSKKQDKADHITQTDIGSSPLIASRRRFDEMLAIEIERAKTTVSYLSILMISIDYFKLYNDSYGPAAGNACLNRIASTLAAALKRTRDLVSKWSDEEFMCILSDTDPIGAANMAETLRKAIMDLAIPHAASPVDQVITVSIGVVTSILTDDTSYEKLLKQAAEALDQAMKMGGNQICIWAE